MAVHARSMNIWWLAMLAFITTVAIAVVLVLEADAGKASPAPTPFSSPSADTHR